MGWICTKFCTGVGVANVITCDKSLGDQLLLDLLQPFCGPWTVSGTTWVSRYQKGKTRKVTPIWIYWSMRQWVAVASAGLYANLYLAPER